MRAYHRKRLLRLADFLDGVPESEFDLGRWWEKTDCGTVACAVGHATTIPEFQQAGLLLVDSPWGGYCPSYDSRDFGAGWGFAAARSFFGLSFEDADHLFSPAAYPSDSSTRPKTVAKRIRQYVEAS